MHRPYLFTSLRLGFRQWQPSDVAPMAAINADKEVMEYIPGVQTYSQTEAFVVRMRQQQEEKGYCYYAIDELANGAFIGFIGLSQQTYASEYTPCVDVGWRLARPAWGRGYAREGAKRCLLYGHNDLGMEQILAIAPQVNVRSLHVMEKAGMTRVGSFIHPLLMNDERLKKCVVYRS